MIKSFKTYWLLENKVISLQEFEIITHFKRNADYQTKPKEKLHSKD